MESHLTSPIKLNLAEKLKDKGYFHRFFRGRTQDEVASQIKELREKRGLKQKELAKRCKTHQSAISRLEQATYSRWNINTLWSLAKALDARVRIIIEPMEDIIRQYEELEREEYVHSATSAAFERIVEQVMPLEMVQEVHGNAASQADIRDPSHTPSTPQYSTGQPILPDVSLMEAR